MRRSLNLLASLLLLVSVSLPSHLLAGQGDNRTYILSNELGSALEGGLIDQLIASGYGDRNLYQILVLLAAQDGSNIPADFVASVGNNTAGSEVFTVALSTFAGLNGPVSIHADGTLRIKPIFGRDYAGDPGYTTGTGAIPGVSRVNYTLADNPTYYIDAGEIPEGGRYLAIGIAWTDSVLCYVLSNEAPGHLIDQLIATGHGSDSLYEVLQLLAADPQSGIPAAFVTQVGNSPAGSEVKTASLSNYTGLNNPVCVNADGTLRINDIFGNGYDGVTGYSTNTGAIAGLNHVRYTLADNAADYIDAGSSGGSGQPTINFRAFGIAWADEAAPVAIPTLSEWGMILAALALGMTGLWRVRRSSAPV